LKGFDYTHIELQPNFQLGKPITNDGSFKIIKLQSGVFRTNCIDCLDRTNVVQTLFSRLALHKMLHNLGIGPEPRGEPFEPFNSVFEGAFKLIWGEHGDHLSLAYSGTNALKGDFTKTGKRTKKGEIEDGINSCKRFYLNNFIDGYNQDCHDYFLGKISPKKIIFREHSTNTIHTLAPSAVIIAIIIYYMLSAVIFRELEEPSIKRKLLKAVIFAGVMYLTIKTIFGNFKNMVLTKATTNY
jgi:hypothetical protein